MRKLIIHGDPGIRKGAVIRYGNEEVTCFGINRNGEWHGPETVQLWCTVGAAEEFDDYQRRNFVPHFLDVDRVDAEEVEVVEASGEIPV